MVCNIFLRFSFLVKLSTFSWKNFINCFVHKITVGVVHFAVSVDLFVQGVFSNLFDFNIHNHRTDTLKVNCVFLFFISFERFRCYFLMNYAYTLKLYLDCKI